MNSVHSAARSPVIRLSKAVSCLFLFVSLYGCTRIYYALMRRIGREKRDILVQRIRDGKKDQTATQQQLKTTLEAFQELTGFDGGDLQKVYNKLNKELDRAQDRTGQLSDRIRSIDKVANDLFNEWQKEIGGINDRTLKAQSTALLRSARQQHEQYMKQMHRTENKIAPVLQAFRDQVTFLKHNLNARAIHSLKSTSITLDGQVAALINDIQESAREADKFIGTLSSAE